MDEVLKERFLVTGAAGFIGANMCRRLVELGAEVHAWSRNPAHAWRLADLADDMRIRAIDIRDADQVSDEISAIRPTVIYHFATYGAYHYQTQPETILETNIAGLWNVLKAAERVGFRLFVNTGSSSEYGYKEYAMRENDLLEPNSFYAVAKAGQSLLCQHVARHTQVPLVTMRPFSVYGPYEEPGRLFPTVALAAMSGQELSMVAPGTCRDFIFVDDLIDAYLKLGGLAQCRGEVINLGTGVQMTLKEVITAFEQAAGTPLRVSWNTMEPRVWDANVWVADISKARKRLDWTPRTSLEEGIQKTLAWFAAMPASCKEAYGSC